MPGFMLSSSASCDNTVRSASSAAWCCWAVWPPVCCSVRPYVLTSASDSSRLAVACQRARFPLGRCKSLGTSIPVTARKDDAPAPVQAALDNVVGSSSISAGGQGRLKVCPGRSWRGCQHWVWSAGLSAPNARNQFCCS